MTYQNQQQGQNQQRQNQQGGPASHELLTTEGRAAVDSLAGRHGFGSDAVLALLGALRAGGGQMAQFSHPDLGGMGQWSRSGMLMIGDMFNNGLKARVGSLCSDAAALLDSAKIFADAPVQNGQGSGGRWPAELGIPSSSGSQNDMHYAVFPDTRRLAIADGGGMTVYDTGDHRIGGVSQQQGGDRTLRFTSQNGTIALADLKVVSPDGGTAESQGTPAPSTDSAVPASQPAQTHSPAPESPIPESPAAASVGSPVTDTPPAAPHRPEAASPSDHEAIFAKIEGLAALHGKGVLTREEFDAKKAELLSRL
jgi:hypothetical protein